MSKPQMTAEGWRCEKQREHLHRARWMDYKDPSVMMLTLVTNQRLPLLGELIGEKIVLTPLGKQVAQEIERIPTYKDATAIEIYHYVIMPDHVHILLRIHDKLPKHIGRYLYWFKVRCSHYFSAENRRGLDSQRSEEIEGKKGNKEGIGRKNEVQVEKPVCCIELADLPARDNRLFAAEYHDRVLTRHGQLAHMKRYIQDNPRRLALKRANKELFTIKQDVIIADSPCAVLGNIFLADYPLKKVIQCSRRLTQEQIDQLKEECLDEAAEGIVHVTAAISEGEKQIARALREAEMPLIVLLHKGFPKPDDPHYQYYKPSGVYFEACAKGKLLLVEPYEQVFELPDIVQRTEDKVGKIPHDTQRYRFVAMNMVAEKIAGESAKEGNSAENRRGLDSR